MEEFQLEPGERVVRSVRKHWLVFVIELLPFLIFAIVPLLINPILTSLSGMMTFSEGAITAVDLANPWVRLLLGSWWLLMWTGLFNTFTHYYLDAWIITTTRIVYINQRRFFNREVSSFLLARVQDVTTDVAGFLPTLIGFGSLRVQTAGEASHHFVMQGIPHPEDVRDLIMREIAEMHQEKV